MTDNADVVFESKKQLLTLRREPLYDLPEGTPGRKVLTFGDAMAAILGEEQNEEFKALRAWVLATKFLAEEQVTLNQADLNDLKKVMEHTKRWVPFINGQIMEYLESLK